MPQRAADLLAAAAVVELGSKARQPANSCSQGHRGRRSSSREARCACGRRMVASHFRATSPTSARKVSSRRARSAAKSTAGFGVGAGITARTTMPRAARFAAGRVRWRSRQRLLDLREQGLRVLDVRPIFRTIRRSLRADHAGAAHVQFVADEAGGAFEGCAHGLRVRFGGFGAATICIGQLRELPHVLLVRFPLGGEGGCGLAAAVAS